MENTLFDIVCPEYILSGHLITKDKRRELYGQVAGGEGSKKPEDDQRKNIIKGTGQPCNKTHIRINWRTNEIVIKSQPMKEDDGFDYTEDFDGSQSFGSITVYVNLKSVVGTGGSQTRTLRECNHFVNAQLNYLLASKNTTCLFANIFDGDEASSKMKLFNYLLARSEFSTVCKYIYMSET